MSRFKPARRSYRAKMNNDNLRRTVPDNAPSSPVLIGKGLTKSFGGLTAINNLDFDVLENEILGIIGPNGAGKTTLFNLITGVLRPDRGEVRFNKEVISGLKPHQICRRGIARTFQIPKPFLSMSVLENVLVGALFGSGRETDIRNSMINAEEILSFVRLQDKMSHQSSQLTLTDRKSLEIARAISTNASVILLDEVVGGLNPTETLEMMELIRQIRNRGMTVLVIEHVMKAVMGVSDRIIVLRQGQKIAEGTPVDIVNNDLVIEAYLGKGYKTNAFGE